MGEDKRGCEALVGRGRGHGEEVVARGMREGKGDV